MRPKFYLSMILLFLGIGITNAQNNDYYYYKGEKIPLRLDRQSLTVSMFKGFTKSSLRGLNIKKINAQNSEGIEYSTIEYQTKPTDKEYNQNLKKLKNNGNVRTVSPNFLGQNGEKIGMSDYFYVKLKKTGDFRKLKQLARKKKVRIIEQNQFMPLWYTLRCTENTIGNTLEVANSFFETRWFASSFPDFLVKNRFTTKNNKNLNQLRETDLSSEEGSTSCANDPDFGNLWGLLNTRNRGIDLNACDAWEITEGNGIKVAVVDTGIELTHNDLADNISSISYDTESNSSPSKVLHRHGTHIAGVISAIRNNNIGVVGIAPQATLISISNTVDETPKSNMALANGINWAWQHGADVINNSWVSLVKVDAIDDAINNALTQGRDGKGTIVVFASGNNNGTVAYPANSNSNILSVGAIQYTGFRSDFSNYGNELDVVAPGSFIISTGLNNSIRGGNGTSQATGYASGVAALILSANPCLTVEQVNNIIEKTAQKIITYEYTYATHSNRPNGSWNNEMGYGLVDAYAAVQMAQQTKTDPDLLDLYIKDSPDDIGEEPNTITGRKIWRSPDIWVRNRRDGIEEHQNPVYKRNNNRNYVYVRITNKSCAASTGGDQVKLYWRKAGTVSRWPESWDGTTSQNDVLMGAPIGTIYIPALEPGEEVVLSFPWEIPNPRDYSNISPNTWHFCLLARIVSEYDPMTNEQDTYTSTNARKNNNIAWKNVTVVKASLRKRKCKNWQHCIVKKGETQSDIRSFGGTISVGNPFDEAKTFSIELVKEESEAGKAIFEESEVSLEMNQTLYNAWKRGGKQSGLLNNTNNEKKKLVKGNHATLDNLRFAPNEMGTLNVSFNFLAKELTDKSEFVYHVIQKETETGEVVGGETYVINKDLQVETEGSVKEERKLEINNKTISIGKASLNKIIPNPASNTVRFTYNLGGAKSAYLKVVGFYHGATKTSTNYDLDINSRETTLDLTNYSDGHYQVALVCDGKIVEAKTLIKE